MKKILSLLFFGALFAIGALAVSFLPRKLPVPEAAQAVLPVAQPPPSLRVAAIRTGSMLSQAAFAYRGGAFGEERNFAMAALLVQHPKGTLLIDAGFGAEVDAHFRTTPALMQLTSKYEKGVPAAQQLRAAGIEPQQLMGVVLTHAHWDHVSGLPDLAGAPVWVTQEERDFIRDGGAMSALARSFGELPYKVYDFPGPAYLGFDKSYDVFADGSVVLVPAGGHTPGSVIAFVNTPDGRRYALIGDLAWQEEGVQLPAEKPWISRRIVDLEPARVRDLIVHLHRLQQAMPELIVIPAHDARAWDRAPKL